MNNEELKLSEEAFRWIKTNREKIIQKFADNAEYVADALPTTLFIDSFFKARENVNKAKEIFGLNIELNLIIKDFEKDLEKLEINIENMHKFTYI